MNEFTKHKVSKKVAEFCKSRVPSTARDQLKLLYKIRGNDVNIIESRPHWQDNKVWTEMPIAKIRYLPEGMVWQLHWVRASGKWQKYPDLAPCKDLEKVLSEIDQDPNFVFWG